MEPANKGKSRVFALPFQLPFIFYFTWCWLDLGSSDKWSFLSTKTTFLQAIYFFLGSGEKFKNPAE